MRLLLRSLTGRFTLTKEFIGNDQIPPYAILSHTWGPETEEVTFEDMINGTGQDKPGYEKIRFCGERARQDGLLYFWIDTCCINKTNKAELSRAINSMFRWYRNATRCYVYLPDVSTATRERDGSSEDTWESDFRSSRWFTRAWTLQDLLAPSSVEFFSREFERLGDKSSLNQQIHEVTGIPELALQGAPLSQFSVHERFSWVASRYATVEEDKAYALLGIFDVYIHPMYGEGMASAFKRLEKQIYKVQKCTQDLRITDPRHDKRRIEDTRGGLLRDSYNWVLNHPDFQEWRSDKQNRLLWIKGDPGKGKTMLLCGIIDELTKSIPRSDLLSYFFCQATDSRINNATAVLRGLIYLLVDQQPSLISHVRSYDHVGKVLFEDMNAWNALSEIFNNILQDPSLNCVYVVIDALDECVVDLPKLLDFVIQKSSVSSRVKWIVSSRNRSDIEEQLELDYAKIELNLELNADLLSRAVDTYIDYKVSQLPSIQEDNDLQRKIRYQMHEKANGNFLWAALVFQQLETVGSWKVLEVLEKMLAGLNDDNSNCTDDQSDAASLESVPSLTNADTFSSVAGLQKFGATHFVTFFQHDEELPTLISFACSSKRKADKFNRKFPRLLKVFASDLLEEAGKQEANIRAKKKSAKIIKSQRDSIAHLLCFAYAADKTTLILENPTPEEQQEIYSERTVSYLEEQDLIKSGDGETNFHPEDIQEGQGNHSDDSDADEDLDETVLHIIEDVKQFVMSSEAFHRLKTEFKDFVFPQLRRDIETDGEAKTIEGPQDDDASSKAAPFNEDYDRQDEHSLLESYPRIGRHRPESNSVQTLHDPTLGARTLGQFWKEGVRLFLLQIIVYIRRWLRPSVLNGFRRVQWTCSCGRELFSDFDNTDSIAIDEFETQLKKLAPGSEQNSRHPQSNPTTNPSRNNSIMESIGIRRGPDAQGSPGQALRSAVNETDSTSISSHFSSLSVPAYFELCVIAGNHKVKLGEIDITNVKSDGELFKMIWNKYQQLRGAELRAIFVKPSNIHFVRFEVIQHHLAGDHLAGIDGAPMEIPPEDEVKKRQYHYHECPLRTKKPMAHNVFLHYMDHARWADEQDGNAIAHNKDTFLNRLPKKLQRSIFETQADTALGWGVLIIEGPNMVAMSFAVALAVVVSFLVSIIFAVAAKTQEQGFGIGSWMMAVFASGMTAWYYREAERNIIGGI